MGLGTFESQSWSQNWICNCSSSCSLGLWLAEPETLGHEGRSMFPKLGVSSVGKSTELVAATLWDVGLDLLGFYKSLDRVSTCMHGLGIVGLHLR